MRLLVTFCSFSLNSFRSFNSSNGIDSTSAAKSVWISDILSPKIFASLSCCVNLVFSSLEEIVFPTFFSRSIIVAFCLSYCFCKLCRSLLSSFVTSCSFVNFCFRSSNSYFKLLIFCFKSFLLPLAGSVS